MLDKKAAISIAKKYIPNSAVVKIIQYKNDYILVIDTKNEESMYDPFYKVNIETGKFSGFSMFIDPDAREIAKALSNYKGGE